MGRSRSDPDREALTWLRQVPPPAGLWMHRELHPVEVAVRLAETLYALGAEKVVVPAGLVIPCDEVAGSNGWAACGFEVWLPQSGPDREALIWFIATESGRPTWGPDVPPEALRSRVGCRTVELAWV
jgi:hypothetical protein